MILRFGELLGQERDPPRRVETYDLQEPLTRGLLTRGMLLGALEGKDISHTGFTLEGGLQGGIG